MKAYQHLEAAERLNKAKNEEYGDGHLRHGQAMSALFPDGLSLFTSDDFARFAVYDLMLVKMVRYAANFKVPHRDSIKDLMVYAAMLEELHDEGDGNRGGAGAGAEATPSAAAERLRGSFPPRKNFGER